jgi:hypothetical protein
MHIIITVTGAPYGPFSTEDAARSWAIERRLAAGWVVRWMYSPDTV